MSSLDIIPLRNNLLVDFKYNQVKTEIKERIIKLNLHEQKYKFDNELLTLICNLVEFLIVKKDKIEKKSLVVDVYNEIFSLTEEEQKSLSNNIQFLWSNKNIKKVSYYRLFKTSLKEWFKKK